MALFHFHVTQIKRSAGQSIVTSAAYRAGEKLYSEYYGEVSDYTHKGGVVCTDTFLPPQAPAEYHDRATLWNAVEKAERGKKAQLAYSFDIALQNEFSLEENIALARQFVSKQLVGRGMIADFAIHQPDKEDGGIPNPHFHVLCPIRPIEESGKWGFKQRRVCRLEENGNRIMGEDGKPLFDAVPTTDWGSPETLEHWREVWAAMVNAKFEEKGLTCRIDHRSYERQGLDLLPTVHEGVAVCQMEAKGITTDKGDFNRWIRKANDLLRNIRRKIADLLRKDALRVEPSQTRIVQLKSPDVSSQVKWAKFRHKVYQFWGGVSPQSKPAEKLVRNGLVVLQSVAGASHVNNLAAVNEAVKDSGGNGSVAKEAGPLVKALVGGNNEGSSLAHGGDKTKEQIGLGGREGHEAHLVHHYEGGLVEILEAALAGTGDIGGLEDGHEIVQGLKGHGVSQVKALDGQGKSEAGLAHTGRTEEADIKGLLHLGHIGQTEHLLPGDAALEAKVRRTME